MPRAACTLPSLLAEKGTLASKSSRDSHGLKSGLFPWSLAGMRWDIEA